MEKGKEVTNTPSYGVKGKAVAISKMYGVVPLLDGLSFQNNDNLFSMFESPVRHAYVASDLSDVVAPYLAGPSVKAQPRHHQRSRSMESPGSGSGSNSGLGSKFSSGSGTCRTELLGSDQTPKIVELKKPMTNQDLDELALIDPKKARRILANRESAARSKERKSQYISELQTKVYILQTQATTLSAQLAILHRDMDSLLAEQGELKLQVQAVEQQNQLLDDLNDALRAEVHRLKIATGQVQPGPTMDYASSPIFNPNLPFYPQNITNNSNNNSNNQPLNPLIPVQNLHQIQLMQQREQLYLNTQNPNVNMGGI